MAPCSNIITIVKDSVSASSTYPSRSRRLNIFSLQTMKSVFLILSAMAAATLAGPQFWQNK